MNNENPSGSFAATVVSAGIGCSAIGLMTVLATAFSSIKEFLNWWNPAGPLTGKIGVGIIAWVLSWILLHMLWKDKELPVRVVFGFSLILIFLGFLGTFPPFFEWFAGH